MNNLFNPSPVLFHEINTSTFTIAAAADGYIDTDVSATTGTDVNKNWFIVVTHATGDGYVGARPLGSANDPKFQVTAWMSVPTISRVDNTGHMELLRDHTGDSAYKFIGYIK